MSFKDFSYLELCPLIHVCSAERNGLDFFCSTSGSGCLKKLLTAR